MHEDIRHYANCLSDERNCSDAEGIFAFVGRSLTLHVFDLTLIGYSNHLASSGESCTPILPGLP